MAPELTTNLSPVHEDGLKWVKGVGSEVMVRGWLVAPNHNA